MTRPPLSPRPSAHSHRRLPPRCRILAAALLLLVACSSCLLSVRAHAGSVEEPGPPFAHCDVQLIRLVSASGPQDLWVADRGEFGEPLERGQYQPLSTIRTTSPVPLDAVRVEVSFQRASGTVMRSVTTCVVNGGFVQFFRAPGSASPPEDATALPTFAHEIQGLLNGVNSITINTDCAEYFYATIVIDDGTSGNGDTSSSTGSSTGSPESSTGGSTGSSTGGSSSSDSSSSGGESGPQDPGSSGEASTGDTAPGSSGAAEPPDPESCELSSLSFSPLPSALAFEPSPAFAPAITSYTGELPADAFLLSVTPSLAAGTTSVAIVTLQVNGATALVLTAGQESASVALAPAVGLATNTIQLQVTSDAGACTKRYTFVLDRLPTLSDGSQPSPGQVFFNWAVGSWGPCSASCGPGITQRSVACQASDNSFVGSFANCTRTLVVDSDGNGIPDDNGSAVAAATPESEASCNLAPCSGGLEGSTGGSGTSGPALSTMCARYAQASFGLGASVQSQTRFTKAVLRRALDGCGSNVCNPSFPGILGASSPFRTGASTSARAEKLRANADSYKDRFLHKVARLFGAGLGCEAQGFPISEQPGIDEPTSPSAESESELAQCITELFPTDSSASASARQMHRASVSLSKGATMHQGSPRAPGRHAGHSDGHEVSDADAAASAESTIAISRADSNTSPTAAQSSLSLTNFASTQLLYALQSYGLSIDDASLAFQRSGFHAPPQLITPGETTGPQSAAAPAAGCAGGLAVMAGALAFGHFATWMA